MSTRPAEEAGCLHCGTLCEGDYCCGGCELAAAMLSEAGLEGYYARRTEPAPRPLPLDGAWQAVPVVWDGDQCVARMSVDGLRCASCVWVTERLLEQTDGVAQAHVSYATGRAEVRWDPEQTDLATIAGRIAAVGYRPRPVDATVTWDRDLLGRLGVAAFCAMNGMSLAAMIYVGWMDGMHPAWQALFRWGTLLLATPVATWSARPFFESALRGLRAGVLHMDVPVSLAVAILYAHGIASTLAGQDAYLDSLMMLVTLLLAGRVLEARGRGQVADAVASLAAQLPGVAHKVVPDGVEDVDPRTLVVGNLVEVPSGAEVPADGVVVDGESVVAMALLTGESEPASVVVGDAVVGGGVVEGAPIRVRVTATGDATLVSRMAEALETSLSEPQRRDAIAPWFTAATLAAAAATFVALGGTDDALQRTIAVLVVACPCALALSRPLCTAAGLGAMARRGLLLRSGDALERLAELDRVGLDKTGTLTHGVPDVVEADDATLRIAAGLERSSAHPVGRAIVREAARRGIPIPIGTQVVEDVGVGMRGVVDGTEWVLRSGGPGVIALYGDDAVRTIRLRDVPRDDVGDAVEALKELGLQPFVLTGDKQAVGKAVAGQLGIPVQAEVGPLEKAKSVKGALFVGDGWNDGPALAAADVGLAMGAGAASSVLVADGVVTADGLQPVAEGIRIARRTKRAIRRSLTRSVVYNVVAVGAAVAGFVNPLVAALLMPLSSLLVLREASRI